MSVKVTVDVTDTSGYVNTSTDRVVFRAKNTIGAADTAGRVISTAPVVVELRGGAQSVNLEPGPHIVTIRARGQEDNEFTFTVPDDVEELTLRDLLENHFDYDPEKIAEAQRYAVQAKGSADAAAASEERLGSAETIVENTSAAAASATTAATEADRAKTEADRATTKADNSATEADRSKTEADRATSAATNAATDTEDLLQGLVTQATSERVAAQNAAESADTHKTEAKASEDAAAASASLSTAQAERSETAADTSRGYNDNAWKARKDAISARDVATQAETDAVSAKDAAQASATNAQASATAAAQSEGVAATAATDAANGVRSELSGLVSTASGHADAAADSAAAAAQSAQDAASVVADGVPDASTTMKGKLKLSGDLAGTADNPTVPGLATKSDTGHTHSVNQVTGLQSALDGKVSTVTDSSRVYGTSSTGAQTAYLLGGANATSGTVPLRVTGGAINTGEPTSGSHAATKTYVDTAVSSKAATTAMNARPALFSGAGAAPSTISGAVVGDWWLNTTTMELSKITGV